MVAYLDGRRLRRALGAGIGQLLSEEDLLNKINVFPVADGDTGTNLALTTRAMLGVIQHSKTVPIGASLTELADAALDGCRGNSGAILAQFFHGLNDAAASATRLTPEQWVKATKVAVAYARDAIERPREGTMLTILEAVHRRSSEWLLREQSDGDFAALIGELVVGLESDLRLTTTQLDVLAKANVVDAGAAGVVALFHGINNLLRGESVSALPQMEAPVASTMGQTNDTLFRFCTECVVTGENLSHRSLRETLANYGNSMVVAGGPNRLKVHIHTNEPDAIFGAVSRFGHVTGQKADDMTRQAAALRAKAGVAIVIDSGGDLPQQQAEELNIHSVPLRIHIGDTSYLDKVSLTFQALYKKVSSSNETLRTSQPPPGDFRRMFEYLDSHFEDVISIQVSDQMSGTLQAARSAADRLDSDHNIQIINSQNISLGQGLLALRAGEWAAQGLSANAIVDKLEALIPRTKTFAIVSDLSYAVRGGRVPASTQYAAKLLGVTPVVYNDSAGRIKTNRVLWGRKAVLEKFALHVARHCDPLTPYRVAIGYGDDPAQAQQLRQFLLGHIGNVAHDYVTEIGAALGVHGGPGILVAAIQPEPET